MRDVWLRRGDGRGSAAVGAQRPEWRAYGWAMPHHGAARTRGAPVMIWQIAHQAHPGAKALADRHYYRKRPDSPQFMPPGRQLVLITTCGRALWATSWPRAELVNRDWPAAWVCA